MLLFVRLGTDARGLAYAACLRAEQVDAQQAIGNIAIKPSPLSGGLPLTTLPAACSLACAADACEYISHTQALLRWGRSRGGSNCCMLFGLVVCSATSTVAT